MKTPYTLILFNWSLDVAGCWYLVFLSLPEGPNLYNRGQHETWSWDSLRAFVWFVMTQASIFTPVFSWGLQGHFNSPDSALTPPLATQGEKPPLSYCPWKEGQAFGSGHSLRCSSRPCLASTWRLLIGDKTIVSVVVRSWLGLHHESRLLLKQYSILQH